jgi:hypothetical protein
MVDFNEKALRFHKRLGGVQPECWVKDILGSGVMQKIPMIRAAKQNEAMALTRISFDAKGYWNYPQEYFEIWKNELTISPSYIENNDVYVYESGNALAGYYSIVFVHEDIDVSGITIEPQRILFNGFKIADPSLVRTQNSHAPQL